jgi:hypothetical protein
MDYMIDGGYIEATGCYVCGNQDSVRGGFESVEILEALFLLELRMQWPGAQLKKFK